MSVTATDPPHLCAAEGCSEELPRNYLMCKAHWRRVPRPLQIRLTDAFNRWLTGEGGKTKEDGFQRVAELRAAQAACVAAVGFVRV